MIKKLENEERLFLINRLEALALYKLLQHEWIPRDENYEMLMRLLNGLSNFIADTEIKL